MTFFVDTTSISQRGEIRAETSDRLEVSSALKSHASFELSESLEVIEVIDASRVSMSLSSPADSLSFARNRSAVSPDLRACNRKRVFDGVFGNVFGQPSKTSTASGHALGAH